VKEKRPINLDLTTMHFPIPAIVSILHRITGVLLFLSIPFLLWGLHLSLRSEEDFNIFQEYLTNPIVKFFIWIIISAFIYHSIAGIRHLLMDIHIGDDLKTGRFLAAFTLGLSLIFSILIGIWLW